MRIESARRRIKESKERMALDWTPELEWRHLVKLGKFFHKLEQEVLKRYKAIPGGVAPGGVDPRGKHPIQERKLEYFEKDGVGESPLKVLTPPSPRPKGVVTRGLTYARALIPCVLCSADAR